MSRINYVEGGFELIDVIGPLWEALRNNTEGLSKHFAHVYAAKHFAERRAELRLAGQYALRVDLVRDGETLIGYCVSSLDADGGAEIESIFVQAEYRGHGVGDALMRRALRWMDDRGAKWKTVTVCSDNLRVFPFYARYGFLPYRTILRQTPQEGPR